MGTSLLVSVWPATVPHHGVVVAQPVDGFFDVAARERGILLAPGVHTRKSDLGVKGAGPPTFSARLDGNPILCDQRDDLDRQEGALLPDLQKVPCAYFQEAHLALLPSARSAPETPSNTTPMSTATAARAPSNTPE
jgi:hypothetical protein